MMKSILTLLCTLLWLPLQSCTDFLLKDAQGEAVVGRSMEFGVNLEPQILLTPSGEKYTSRVFDNKPGLSWTTQYSYVAITSFADEIVTDGMNEAGLSFGLLWFPDVTEYPKLNPADSQNSIALKDLGSWILGNFSTVDEVRAAIQKIQLWPHKVPKIPYIPPVHLSIHDKSGKSIVVEYLKGKVMVFDNLVGALTNTPEFPWQVTNLSNYLNLSPISETPLRLENIEIHPLGMGSGLLGIPGDWTSPSRFVRIVTFKNIIHKASTPRENVNAAFHLLNTVDIPFGALKSADGSYVSYTQWVVVKDLKNLQLHYRSYDDLNIKSIKLEGNKRRIFPLK
ncbi:MAG: choloylglycine hydrolase family protein [Simkania sp.]|nr:choloylglycine hydrolase family protein [Simkania sp.]MCB1073977.1 choloylglycine hydrolase family protein [Simkania sp.]MCP5490771.1 choloylglycine hydrolase family protein [Chlamydiales bacterium]